MGPARPQSALQRHDDRYDGRLLALRRGEQLGARILLDPLQRLELTLEAFEQRRCVDALERERKLDLITHVLLRDALGLVA